jgi:inosose dehydratase
MSLHDIRLATGPVSWGVDFADAPANPPWPLVLDEIAATGIGALELGPVGYLPEDPERLAGELALRRLRCVGSFVFEDLHDPLRQDDIVAIAERACRVIRGAGGRVLVVIDRVSPERAATVARSDAARRLDGRQWRQLLDGVNRVADVAHAHDLQPVLHPHAGSYVEFADEVERLLADTALPLCLDTGHLALAGIEPATAIRAYGGRLEHLHLKDVDPAVLGLVRRERLDFWAAVAAGVFCPLGRGTIDVAAVTDELARLGYAGFATIEQDRLPAGGTPGEDVCASVALLARHGLGSSGMAEAGFVVRTLRALELLSIEPRSVAEVADELGIHVRTARRLLSRLDEEGYVRRAGPRRLYTPTLRIVDIAGRVAEREAAEG